MTAELGLAWRASGGATLTGFALELSRRLDRMMSAWAATWEAREYEFPPLLSVAELACTDYLSSFQHLATFPVTLARSETTLTQFAERNRGQRDQVELGELEPARAILTPAACYHVYHHLRGTDDTSARYATTRGTCFRREAEYTLLERQYSFSMREIVCIGSADDVKTFLATMRRKLESSFERWDWPVKIAAATDPFFGGADNPKLRLQQLDPVKHELVFQDRLAIGSLNFHRNYFGEAYGISHRGKAAFSGCVAFGIERWLAALVALYGPDPRRFPPPFQLSEALP